MRKLMVVLTLLGLMLVAGCGGGGGEADSPLDNALGYLPADAPFAVAIDTQVESGQYDATRDALERFGVREQVDELLKILLEGRTGDFERFERGLGNAFVAGSPSTRHFVGAQEAGESEDAPVVGAIQLSDEDAVDALVDRKGLEPDGEAHGAQFYKDELDNSFAIEGDTLIVAGSKAQLEQALETRDSDERLTEDDFKAAAEGLPEDALLRFYLDIGAILRASENSADALKVKWVDAVRTGGIAFTFDEGEVTLDVNVNTDPEGLAEADLPIAAGPASPELLDRQGEAAIALRDPARLLDFAQRAGRTVDPDRFGAFLAGRAQIERRLDIDIDDDLLGQLEDDLAITIDPDGSFGARATLEDPQRFERTLAKLGELLPDLAKGALGERVGFAEPKQGEDFYALATEDGDSVVFGVVDGAFVLANDASLAGQLAAAGTRAVEGVQGSVVVSGDAQDLVARFVDRLPIDDLAGLFPKPDRDAMAPLDQLVGSLEASTERLSGSFRITLDEPPAARADR
ncbi:MAG: DUF3352 domain-containing protein [Thermoleophilaceae bacterium]